MLIIIKVIWKNCPELRYGDLEVVSDDGNYVVFKRNYENNSILIVCNFDEPGVIDMPKNCGELLLTNNVNRKGLSNEYMPFDTAIYRLD